MRKGGESIAIHAQVSLPHRSGERLGQGRKAPPETIQSIVEELINPEAAYFTDMDGARGGYLVINMDDASQIPAMAEPLFLRLGATIELHAMMTVEDLEKGFPALEQAAQKYG